jgi:hemerythrin-like domain-containing protein
MILRALDILEHMAVRADNDQPVEPADVESILRFLRTFADDYHQTKEESALFPELMGTSAAQQGPLRHMLFEHDQERSLVEGLEDALYTKKGAEFVYFANRLTDLLRNHIRKEDNILFEIVERALGALSSEQDEKVAEEFNKFEINVGRFQDALHCLEWKYLRRAA